VLRVEGSARGGAPRVPGQDIPLPAESRLVYFALEPINRPPGGIRLCLSRKIGQQRGQLRAAVGGLRDGEGGETVDRFGQGVGAPGEQQGGGLEAPFQRPVLTPARKRTRAQRRSDLKGERGRGELDQLTSTHVMRGPAPGGEEGL
jgi:hypothetical protein